MSGLTQQDLAETAARKKAAEEAEKRIRDILAKHPTTLSREPGQDQKITGLMGREARTRDAADHKKLGNDY